MPPRLRMIGAERSPTMLSRGAHYLDDAARHVWANERPFVGRQPGGLELAECVGRIVAEWAGERPSLLVAVAKAAQKAVETRPEVEAAVAAGLLADMEGGR